MTDIATFNRLPAEAANEMLRACCGATRWVEGMLARRPFVSILVLLSAADDVWRLMGPGDWREAFEHHPRLGDSSGAAAQDKRARTWSSGEQAGMAGAGADERAVLEVANAAYEARFGYICIICATEMGVAEIAMLTEERLRNELEEELPVAAEEQRKITRLRLLKLFHDPEVGSAS
ncbi:MAG: 2-oxo-4-hydroxy-4-carboxy-5-ureidoimidazoline decarboxylase [Gemmatimonadaceae bacterium]|nr:2-oxo-4-hydroxy-4-carboxy-5-ureidoimidazoline decarboxylase [Gemmatimonadaceae bacterium]